MVNQPTKPHAEDRTTLVVTLSGELDIFRKEMLRESLAAAEQADVAVIDMTGVTFLDSAALGVLIGFKKRLAERKGTVRVVLISLQLRRLFEITGLERVFEIYPSLESAITL